MPEVRLIDANAEVERLKSDYCKDCTRKGNYGIFGAACTPCWVKDAVEEFENAPTIEAEPMRHGNGCSYCKGRSYSKKPLTVITRTMKRVEVVFEYCPACGRKMDGGADNG